MSVSVPIPMKVNDAGQMQNVGPSASIADVSVTGVLSQTRSNPKYTSELTLLGKSVTLDAPTAVEARVVVDAIE